MNLSIPRPLKLEHEELHAELRKATEEPGRLGEAAKAVAELMHPHFIKEEDYALPPLGLLPQLARGEVTPEMADVLAKTDRLRAELDEMLAEHRQIVAALETLSDVAGRENRPEYVRFAGKLIQHAQTEEQVSYPAALLVGEFVRTKLGGPGGEA